MSFKELEVRMNDELWAPIPYYSHFEVSNYGRVRRDGNRIMKHGLNNMGYHHVWLCEQGIPTAHQVHRLVAFAFVKKRDPEMAWVGFKDGDRENLRADNLEWRLRSWRNAQGHAAELPTSPRQQDLLRQTVQRLAMNGWHVATLMRRFKLTEVEVLAHINAPPVYSGKERPWQERAQSLHRSKFRLETIALRLGVPLEDVVDLLVPPQKEISL